MSHESCTKLTLEIPPVPRGVDAWASLAGGLWMVALAGTNRMRARVPVLAVGGWLLARGAMGVVQELSQMHALHQAAKPQRVPQPNTTIPVPEDPLDEANWESFPASDPPSITAPKKSATSNGVH